MATTPPVGSSNVSSLSDWAGGYVTDMLGKAQAIADQPYQVYQGPMTAGESGLQSKVFQGLGSLNFPSNLGQSFSSPMGGQQYGQQPYLSQMSGTGGAMSPGGSYGSLTPQWSAPGTGSAVDSFGQPYVGRGSLANDAIGGPMGGDMGVGTTTYGGMGESSVGSMGYAAPTTGGGTTTLGGMPPGGYDAMGGQGMPPQTLSSYAPPMIHGQQGQMQPQGIAGLQPPQGSQQPSNIAQSYMNPYLQSVLNPQMDELRRQNEITNMQANAKLTGAGAFGGGRQAIMNAENNRNLMMEQNKTVGQGYANAYDKAMGQFNTEQGQARDLANLMSTQGGQQRDIEQQGISADYNEFLAQRDYPMKQTQYLQSMLQGLPISTVSNQAAQQSGIGQLSSTVGGLGNIMESLKKLGL
jgi:hypothetical protein